MFLITPIAKATQNVAVFAWDISLTLFNLVTPNMKEGHVIPEGHPGAGGVWPEFIAPKEGDSRSCCPALNAMANHGMSFRERAHSCIPNCTFPFQASSLETAAIFHSKSSTEP
jgi:hypothetical protein